MPGSPRKGGGAGLYHAFARGVGRQAIFEAGTAGAVLPWEPSRPVHAPIVRFAFPAAE